MRLGQQPERLHSEVAVTVEEASLKSAYLRIRVDGFAASTQTIVKVNHEIAATSNQIAAAMDETATNALDLITALRQAKTEVAERSEEHTSELQSLMRISYAVFCLKQKIRPFAIHAECHKHLRHIHHHTRLILYGDSITIHDMHSE